MTASREAGGGSVDVVVPTFNNVDDLRRCLDSIGSDDVATIFVCVDGSFDGTLEYLRSVTPGRRNLVVLEHDDRQNHGRAAARNLALRHVKAEFVLLLDSDMRLTHETVAKHAQLLRDRRCASVGRVVYDNARQNVWAQYLMTRGANKGRAGAVVRPLDFVTANAALRRVDLVAVGGFDESLQGYGGEDTELALRLHNSGVDVVFNPDALAIATEPKTIERGLAELNAYARTNLRATRARHPEGPAPYWIDLLDSSHPRDRLLRALMNPVTDALVRLGLLIPWFPLQRRLLSYAVLRAVWTGYRAGQA